MASNVTVVIATKGAKEAGDDIKSIGVKAEESSSHLSRMTGALGDVSKIAGGFVLGQALTTAPDFLMSAAKAAAEDEQSTMRLQQAIKNLGGDYSAHIAAVNDAISAGQKKAFTDDETRDAMVKLTAATGDTDEALKRLAVAQDLARGANIPLADASKLLGKVTDDNLQVFKRMGITLPDVANEADVLAAVQKKFAGQSDAYAQSTAGQFAILQDRMSEAKETIGANLLPVMMKIGDVLATDVMPKIEAFANGVGPKLAAIGEFFTTNIKPKLEEFGAMVQQKFKDFQAYYDSDLKPAIDNIVAGFKKIIDFVREHWDEIKAVVKPVIDEVVNIIQTGWSVVQGVFEVIIDLINGDWSKAWDDIKGIAKTVVDGVKDSLGNLLDFIQGLVSDFAKAGKDLAGNLKDGIMGIDWWGVGADIIHWAKQGLEDMAWSIIDAASSIAGKIGEKLNPKNWVGSPMGIQNWFPYYFEMGMENLAAQVASSPGLTAATSLMSEKLSQVAREALSTAAVPSAAGFRGGPGEDNLPNELGGTFLKGYSSVLDYQVHQKAIATARAAGKFPEWNAPQPPATAPMTIHVTLAVDGAVLAQHIEQVRALAMS